MKWNLCVEPNLATLLCVFMSSEDGLPGWYITALYNSYEWHVAFLGQIIWQSWSCVTNSNLYISHKSYLIASISVTIKPSLCPITKCVNLWPPRVSLTFFLSSQATLFSTPINKHILVSLDWYANLYDQLFGYILLQLLIIISGINLDICSQQMKIIVSSVYGIKT